MPSDIDPKSGMRLPLPKREELDEAGQKAYDRSSAPGASIAGLQGPGGIQWFSPKTAANRDGHAESAAVTAVSPAPTTAQPQPLLWAGTTTSPKSASTPPSRLPALVPPSVPPVETPGCT